MNLKLDAKIFNPLFFKLLNSKSDIVVNYGGSGSSKSFSLLQVLIYKCLTNKNERIMCLRQTLVSTKDTIYDIIIVILSQWGILSKCKCNSTTKTITFPNGSFIFCKGLDNPESLKSLMVSNIFIEEATEISEKTFNLITTRLRGTYAKNGKIYLNFNPIDIDHWLYKRFFNMPENPESFEIFHTTYKDNKFLNDRDIRALNNLQITDPHFYNIYALGNFGMLDRSGAFYPDFEYSKIVKDCQFDPINDNLFVSIDENVNPYFTILCGYVRIINGVPTYHIFKEYCHRGKHLDAVMKMFINDFKGFRNTIFLGGDSTSKKKNVLLESDQSLYSIIEQYLKDFKVQRKLIASNQSVKTSGLYMNHIFRNNHDVKIVIDPSCTELINDLKTCMLDAEGGKSKAKFYNKETKTSEEKNGHTSDALTYMIIQNNYENWAIFKSGSMATMSAKIHIARKTNKY